MAGVRTSERERRKFIGGSEEGQRSPRIPRLRRASLLACLCAAWSLASADAAHALTPSPSDWRDLVLYQVVTDRFANGDGANDAVEGNYAPSDGAKNHGGDFAGLVSKLDYLQQLGVDGVWISPVVLNANAEYHGYAARDFYAIAPHFGSLAELQSLVAACHARGLVVILDVVVNHMGDLIDSGDPGYANYKYPGTYNLRWRNGSKRHAGFFDDLTRFHAHGSIGNFTDPEQIVGELFGLDDLKTEDAAVRAELIAASEWIIDQTDCDGFRIDTVKHVEMSFWSAWAPAVHAHAASVGKSSFFVFGEAFDGSDGTVGSYTGTMGGGAYKFDSMLWYPMYYTTQGVFRWADTSPSDLAARNAALGLYDATSRERLVTFLDNHDNARFLAYQGPADGDEGKLRAALAWQLTSRGVPMLYYGIEQAFDGGGDPYNREDMWDGAWDFGPSDGDNFDETQPLFRWVRTLVEVRRAHEALRRGTTTERYVETAGPGLYVFERRTASDTVLVALNTSNAPLARPGVATSGPGGPPLADALAAPTLASAGAGGALDVEVPARGARVYESAAARAARAPFSRLHVTAIAPGHDQRTNDRWSPLRIAFDRDVRPEAVEAALAIVPAALGVVQVEGREARFFPSVPWATNVTYRWSLAATLQSDDGAPLAARFEAQFTAGGVASGVTLPAGYVADRIAQQGLVAPEGIANAPALGALALLVTDTGKDRALTLTSGGDLGHWLGDSRWSAPEGLCVDADGTLSIVDDNGVFEAGPDRITAALTTGNSATQTGAIARGPAAFGGLRYLCDPVGNRVLRLSASNVLETFASGVSGPEGLAFGPGGAWGSDLYVADANLTSAGGIADGASRICRVTSAGAISTFVQNTTLLRGACGLAFDPTGDFGGHLYVADVLGERILQVTSAGAVSVFASGFKNLAGSHALAFGPDGALYVADPGSGTSFTNSAGTNAPQVVRIARAVLTLDAPERGDGGARLDAPAPSPSRGDVTLRFGLPRASWAALELFDPAGRRVRTLARGRFEAGERAFTWNRADDRGARVAPGLYFARLTWDGGTRVRRIVTLE